LPLPSLPRTAHNSCVLRSPPLSTFHPRACAANARIPPGSGSFARFMRECHPVKRAIFRPLRRLHLCRPPFSYVHIIFNVNKCQPLYRQPPSSALLEASKKASNVAKCGSRAARFRIAPRRVACWLRLKSRAHVGQMWGTPATVWPFAVGGRQSSVVGRHLLPHIENRSNVGVSLNHRPRLHRRNDALLSPGPC
jgi:hypothetical protein